MATDVGTINKRLLTKGAERGKVFDPKTLEVRVADLGDHEAVLRTIQARLGSAYSCREPHQDLWKRSFMAWMQILSTKKEKGWESKRYLPLILQQVETASPIIYNAVFNGPHIWRFFGQTPNGRNAADALDKLIHWQARGPSRVMTAIDEMNFFSLLLGTGILDTKWSNKQEDTWVPRVHEEEDENGERVLGPDGEPIRSKVLMEERVTVEDWPIVKAINPLNIWFAPHGRVGDTMPWGVEHVQTTVGEIEDAAGSGHVDKDAVSEWLDTFQPGDDPQEQTEALFEGADTLLWDQWRGEAGLDGRDGDESRYDDVHMRDKRVSLLEYRSRAERITVAPGRRIIGYSKNPYKHKKTGWLVHNYIPIHGGPWGRGIGSILLGHQELINENMNLYMDTARISLMAPTVMNRNSVNPTDKNTVWTPNKIILARDVNNAIRRVDLPAPTAVAFSLDNHLKMDAELTTGFSKQSAGVASSEIGTATEANAVQSNMNVRTIMHVIRMKETVRLLGDVLVSLNEQFMTEEQVVSVVGEDGMDYHTIKPWEIVGGVVVQCSASAQRANTAMRAQQLIGAMQIFLPMLQKGSISPTEARLMRAVLQAIEVEDVDLLIPKPSLTMRDAMVENVALERGVPVEPSEYEPFSEHTAIHATRRQELEAEGASKEILANFDLHIQKTSAMSAQVGQRKAGPQQQPPQADQLGGPRPGGQQATALGAAAGNQGVPGAAAPGPVAAPGRPL